MSMDYETCAQLVRKYALPGELHDLMRTASKPYRYQKTTIHLTYLSMPDWLAVISAAASPASTGSADEPIVEVLRDMVLEGSPAALDILWFDSMAPSERERLFRRLVLAYKKAAERHQASVADCLNLYTRKGSGRALLAELGRTRFTVTVMPHWVYFMTLPKEGFRNACVVSVRTGQGLSHITDGMFNNARDAYAKGASIDDREKGTGKGSNALVYYSEGTWRDDLLDDGLFGEAGFEADEVLFHELVHVTRMTRGQMTSVAVTGRPEFGNIEEYFATVITNIYLSEKGARLVGTYGHPAHPPKDWALMKDPDGFYGNNDGLSIPPSQLMETFKLTQAQFYHDLALLPTPPKFNPVKTHFKLNQRIPV
jgi:hypothetical protein